MLEAGFGLKAPLKAAILVATTKTVATVAPIVIRAVLAVKTVLPTAVAPAEATAFVPASDNDNAA